MPSYKLYYFDTRGLAEMSRIICHLGKIPYEDIRIPRDQWEQKKKDFPFEKVPVLEVDGVQIPQSTTIARFLAKKAGLAGKTDVEEAVVDSLVDQFKDFWSAQIPYYMAALIAPESQEKMNELYKKYVPEKERFFGFLTKYLERSKTGYLSGGDLTFIDIIITEYVSTVRSVQLHVTDGFPLVAALVDKVTSIPEMNEYLTKRPKTPLTDSLRVFEHSDPGLSVTPHQTVLFVVPVGDTLVAADIKSWRAVRPPPPCELSLMSRVLPLMRILFFFSLLQSVLSLNVLLYLIGSNQFERSTFEFLAQQLALRHHNVITVKPILIPEEPRLVKPKLHLVKEKTLKNLLPKNLYEPLEKAGDVVPWKQSYELDEFERPYWVAHNASCYKILNSNLMDTLKKETLDVGIVYSGNPCQLAINHVLGIPTIYFDLEGLTDETLVAAGVPLDLNQPSSHCLLPDFGWKRVRNGLCYLQEYLVQSGLPIIPGLLSQRYKNLDGPITKMWAEDYTIKKRFPVFPNVNQLKQQSALFFVNTDPLLEYPRALPPHVIPVGGLHLDHPKPLFSPWNTSIGSAESGLIVVSLGTQANSASMTPSQAKAILGALSKLTQYRIYWRIGPNMKLPGIEEGSVPSHINLTAFIPQNDLLAHKDCKLLVTNGGMSSLMEAVAYGVPVVGIPLYGSNRHNLHKAAHKGLGLVVEKQALSEATLLKAMRSALDTPKYKTNAKDMSKEFKARASTPFSTALHYIEHVGKHHAATFFSSERCRCLFSQLNVDFIGVLLLLLAIPLYLPFTFVRKLFSRKPAAEQSKSKKEKESKKEK